MRQTLKFLTLTVTLTIAAMTAAAQTTAKEFYEKGKAESQKGEFKAAGENYRKAYELDPKAMPPALSDVVAKMNAKDVAGGYEALSAAIKADPNDPYFYFIRGIISTVPGAPPSAAGTMMADLEKVLAAFPNNAGAYFFRSAMRLDKVDLDGAIADATTALDLRAQLESRDIAGAYFNRGKARFGKKDYDGANLDLTKAIELDPKNVDLYLVRAGARVNKNDMQGVIADYSKVIELQPSNAQAIITRGQIRMGTKDWDGSIADFTKAIQIDPKNAQIPYYNRAQSRFSKDDYPGAIVDCTKSIEVDPKYAPAYDLRGLMRGITNDPTGSVTDITKAIQLVPDNPEYYKHRANQYRGMNKLALAAADEKRAAALEKK